MKTKTKLLFLTLIMLVLAQNVSSQDVRFGAKAGMDVSSFVGPDESEDINYGKGFSTGLFLETRISPLSSFCFEANFTRRMSYFSESVFNVDNSIISVKEDIYYLAIPMFYRLRFGKEIYKAYLNLGGEIAAIVYEKRNADVTIDDYPVNPEIYFGYKTNFFDYGFAIGAGTQYRAVLFELKYYLSLNNLYSNANLREIRFQTITASIGYEINHPEPLKKRKRKISFKKRFKRKWRNFFKK